MIFISVGTHPQSFTRLLQAVARYADAHPKEKIIVQRGTTPFSHSRVQAKDFFGIEEFESLIAQADVIVTHAGEGNIGTAIKYGKPMVIVPRLHAEGEHTNDHQLELARAAEKEGWGIVVQDVHQLDAAIARAKELSIPLPGGHIAQTLFGIANEWDISPTKKFPLQKSSVPKRATIIVATLNGGEPLIRAVKGMLAQEFDGKYDIVVVDDGSFDGKTPGLLKQHFEKNPKVKLVFLPRSGVCKARNAGIRASSGDVVINLDHDCIPEKDWLQTMVKGFDSPAVGVVSAYGHYGGTSTGFRKELLDLLGGYDEDYFYYREDTDLSFRIMELGYRFNRVQGARYHEDRTLVKPEGVKKILRYTWQRYRYHMNDVQLHQKHPTQLCEKMLHVHFGHFVNPVEDFKVATGLWENPEKEMEISSPRGMTFVQSKGVPALVGMTIVGLGYAIGMKVARLAGSIKQGHLLV